MIKICSESLFTNNLENNSEYVNKIITPNKIVYLTKDKTTAKKECVFHLKVILLKGTDNEVYFTD